jgi:hypothetical protein
MLNQNSRIWQVGFCYVVVLSDFEKCIKVAEGIYVLAVAAWWLAQIPQI